MTAQIVAFAGHFLGVQLETWQVATLYRADAARHLAALGMIRDGRAPRQLTTGDDVFEVITHDPEACTICSPLVGPLFVDVPAEPCRCWYWTETGGMRITSGFFIFTPTRADCSGFQTNPQCPHHGEAHG